MGFFVDPIKLQVNGTDFGGIFISWDGVDSSVASVRQLATQLCLNGRHLMGELMLHPENDEASEQMHQAHVIPFLKAHREQFAASIGADADFIFEDDDGNGVADVFEELDVYTQTRVAVDLAAPFLDWTIDFSAIGGIVTRFRMNKAAWDQCRATTSKMSMKDRAAVERYQKAFEALVPGLRDLEQKIKAADDEAEKWRKGAGQSALAVLSLITVTHEMVAVYCQQDAKANRISARVRELLDAVGAEVEKDVVRAMAAKIKAIEAIYKSKDFNRKLYEYLDAWDPSHVYYFHAVAARASDAAVKDLSGFDTRLFKTLGRGCELLTQKAAHAEGAAEELHRAALATWKIAVDGPTSIQSLETRRKKQKELLDELLAKKDAGWLSTFAVWSGMATTYTGNMEGPPSIASIALSAYSRNDHFLQKMRGKDGLLRMVVMWGVDPVERKAILTLLKQDSQKAVELGRTIFNNGSWRAPSVFAAFYVFSAAVLLQHVNDLVDEFESGGGSGDFDADLLKVGLPIAQDLLGIALIGFTKFYSDQMGAYLRTNGVQRLDELSTFINVLEEKTTAAKAARFCHRTLTSIGLVLAIWTFGDETPTADVVEDWLLGLTAGAAFVSLVASVFRTSLGFLGPWGFAAGVLLGLMLAAYQKWFKPRLGAAMQGVGKQLLDDPYLKSKRNLVVGKTSWIIFETDVTLETLLEEVVDELVEFDWERKLNPAHLVDYSRAGLPPKMIAELYGKSEADVKKELKAARTAVRRRKLAAVKTEINLVSPGTLLVKFKVGAFNVVRFEVTHNDREQLPRNCWLELPVEKPDELLADNGQTPATTYSEKQVVMLHTDSSTRFGRVYEGSFRLNELPPGGKFTFLMFAPSDRFATGPTPGIADALVTRSFTFEVDP